ncbi:MAG: DUF1800 family protein [Acidobacteriota bacterium]
MRTTTSALLGPIAAFLVFLPPPAQALIDLDGDEMSDAWEILHGGDLTPGADLDGDGRSNLEESRHGTDPYSATSFLPQEPRVLVRGTNVSLEWPGVPGIRYQVERSDGTVVGSPVQAVGLGRAPESLSVDGASELACGLDDYQLVVVQVDADRDGLTLWEELALGFDDSRLHGNGGLGGGDHPAAIAALYNGDSVTLFDTTRSAWLPTRAEASRFLHQATLGAPIELIDQVASLGFEAWMRQQHQLSPGLMMPFLEPLLAANVDLDEDEALPEWLPRRAAWWQQVMTSPDLLRQRMALAFSEILVVSDRLDELEDSGTAMGTYYDVLITHGLGSYHDLLYEISRNPAMGTYLSHLGNRKADPVTGRFPDENYAREVMQLFSIGLTELNPDGSERLDAEGRPIPTYDNGDITEMARVFTGFDWPFSEEEMEADVDFAMPMFMNETEHDTGSKRLVGGRILPAGNTGLVDVRAATDHLVDHHNAGPFIGRRLIQRLVTSNPSPDYIRRVAAVFADNGAGVRGDLAAVTLAILLDPEARGAASLSDPYHGRIREPFLRRVTLARAFDASSASGTYDFTDETAWESFAQRPMSSPSVFNFFQPDHSPAGPIADAGLFAPELQITTAVTVLTGSNYLRVVVEEEVGEVFTDNVVTLNLEDELDLASDPAALIDRLDLILTAGLLSPGTRATILDAITPITDPWDRTTTAMHLLVISPDFVVAK